MVRHILTVLEAVAVLFVIWVIVATVFSFGGVR